MNISLFCPRCDHSWHVNAGEEVGDCTFCQGKPILVDDKQIALQFNNREAKMLCEIIKFLNSYYAVQSSIHSNNDRPDFNEGQLTVEEEIAFWKKIGSAD